MESFEAFFGSWRAAPPARYLFGYQNLFSNRRQGSTVQLLLSGALLLQAVLDSVIDAASSMQNLREAIAGYRNRLIHESNEHKRNALLHVCLEYLERYYVMIAFTAYISNQDFDPLSSKQATFGAFMKDRSELRRWAAL